MKITVSDYYLMSWPAHQFVIQTSDKNELKLSSRLWRPRWLSWYNYLLTDWTVEVRNPDGARLSASL